MVRSGRPTGRATSFAIYVALTQLTFTRDTIVQEYNIHASEVESAIKYLARQGIIEPIGRERPSGRGRPLAIYQLVQSRESDAWQIYDQSQMATEVVSERTSAEAAHEPLPAWDEFGIEAVLRASAERASASGDRRRERICKIAASSLSSMRFLSDLPEVARYRVRAEDETEEERSHRSAVTPLEPLAASTESWLDLFLEDIEEAEISDPDVDADVSLRSFRKGTDDFILIAGSTEEDVDAAITLAIHGDSLDSCEGVTGVSNRIGRVLRTIRSLGRAAPPQEVERNV